MKESELTDPEATKKCCDRCKRKGHNEQTGTVRTTGSLTKVKSVHPSQHLAPLCLGKQQGPREGLITLTLHKSHTQFPVGTSTNCAPGNSQRARRRDISQGTKVPHDGPAEVPVHLDTGRHRCVTGVWMTHRRPVLAPDTQSGSGASRLGGSGNVGRAERMNLGDIQQGRTVGAGEGSPQCRPEPPDSQPLQRQQKCKWAPHAHDSLRVGDVAESFLPVVVPTQAAPTQAIATHGVVNVAALDVTTIKTCGGGDMWVDASSYKAEVASVDDVAVREANIRKLTMHKHIKRHASEVRLKQVAGE
jgi:hypothetical protein